MPDICSNSIFSIVRSKLALRILSNGSIYIENDLSYIFIVFII